MHAPPRDRRYQRRPREARLLPSGVAEARELDEMIRAALAPMPRVAAAWVFGSMARGDAGPRSDLDVAVLPRAELGRDDIIALRELAGRLEAFSPSGAVDVLVLGPQGPVLRHRILREGRLVHDADAETRIAYEGRTIAEYLDWKPTHDIAMRSALSGIRDRLKRAAS